MTKPEFDKLAKIIQDLWPSYKINLEILGMIERMFCNDLYSTVLAECRQWKFDNPDKIRPSLSVIREAVRAKTSGPLRRRGVCRAGSPHGRWFEYLRDSETSSQREADLGTELIAACDAGEMNKEDAELWSGANARCAGFFIHGLMRDGDTWLGHTRQELLVKRLRGKSRSVEPDVPDDPIIDLVLALPMFGPECKRNRLLWLEMMVKEWLKYDLGDLPPEVAEVLSRGCVSRRQIVDDSPKDEQLTF